MEDTFACPNCGAEVRVGTPSCLNCGSDDETGWSDDTLYDGLDLPESSDEYIQFEKKKKISRVFAGTVAFLLLFIFIFVFIF
jgi:uncharacterized membrane protein YvbJ